MSYLSKTARACIQARLLNPKEKQIAAVIQDSLNYPGSRFLELLFQLDGAQWRAWVWGDATAKLLQELEPIAARALLGVNLTQQADIEDATQRLYLKLVHGQYFKNYCAMRSIPREYILGCAKMLIRTIARSMYREARRYRTNEELVSLEHADDLNE